MPTQITGRTQREWSVCERREAILKASLYAAIDNWVQGLKTHPILVTEVKALASCALNVHITIKHVTNTITTVSRSYNASMPLYRVWSTQHVAGLQFASGRAQYALK